jgi:predicted transcriptional regulator with HTH domain
MPPISKKKRSKISEHILSYLYEISPNAEFTSKIANNIVRDEEFTKSLLEELEKNRLVTKVTKGSKGQDYNFILINS